VDGDRQWVAGGNDNLERQEDVPVERGPADGELRVDDRGGQVHRPYVEAGRRDAADAGSLALETQTRPTYDGLFLWQEYKDGADLDESCRSIVADHKDDADYWKVHIYDPGADRPLDYTLCDRGSLMLYALRKTVGDEVFFRTLKTWTAEHRYGNASSPEFEQLAAKVSGRDLTGFFQAWAHSSTIPAENYLYPGTLRK